MAKIRRNLGIPAGVVFQSAATNAPHGYLFCDGTEVLKSDYPELYASIGDTYGTPVAGSLYFCLPDYRGMFLRGVDGSAGKDTGAAARTAMKTGAITGNNVGSVQADENKAHSHFVHAADAPNNTPTNATYSLTDGIPGVGSFRYSTSPATRSPTGSSGGESRPKNVSVNYIIKY